MPFTVSQIAEQLRGEVPGDGSVELTGFASADPARNGDLTFAEREAYFAAAQSLKPPTPRKESPLASGLS